MKIRSVTYVLAVLVGAQMCLGQTTTKSKEKRPERTSDIAVVRVPAVSEPQTQSSPATQLSSSFVVPALKSTAALRAWQNHLSTTISNGYPPSESWISMDRDRAVEALSVAATAVSTEADKAMLQQLAAEFETMDAWSTGIMEAYKNLRLAAYYMSPSALQNDDTFQHSAQCTQVLMTELTRGELAEQPLCR